jgi:hypothetical protein
MEDQNVHIRTWPALEHQFLKPVDLNMFNNAQQPLHLNMNLREGQVLPVCIKLCEPICAESNYKIGLSLMGQPFIEIVVQGITRIFNCRDKTPGAAGNTGSTGTTLNTGDTVVK